MFETEIRRMLDEKENHINGIFNIGEYVVNINNLTISKEGGNMLENEKNFKLEQLNSLKGEYEKKLEELKALDINSLIDEKVAKLKAEVEIDVKVEHENDIYKAELKLEAINEMIAEVEAVEIEAPVEETAIEDVQDDVPAEAIEVESQVDEFQNDMITEERPII